MVNSPTAASFTALKGVGVVDKKIGVAMYDHRSLCKAGNVTEGPYTYRSYYFPDDHKDIDIIDSKCFYTPIKQDFFIRRSESNEVEKCDGEDGPGNERTPTSTEI